MIDIPRHAKPLIEALGGPFEIVEQEESFVRLLTPLVELTIHYDPRDLILISMLRPRDVPNEIEDFCQVSTLLRMLGFDDDSPELQGRRLPDLEEEIRVIGIVMRNIYLAGPPRIRDAYFFDHGFNAGYTSHFT